MKKVFKIGTGIFGRGKTKICVPVVAKSRDGIWEKAREIAALSVDVAEWRVDFYEDAFCIDEVLTTLAGLKKRLEGKAVLFTFRTKEEGGSLSVGEEDYYRLNLEAAGSGCADLIDVEAYLNRSRTADVIRKIQAAGSHVIASNHDFDKTPPVEEMVRRLRDMEESGADTAKLAVMPSCRQDVLNLLQATIIADEELSIPVVTMSMGKMGVISRICADLTGSAMTFASVGETSAPGQIPAELMEVLLNMQEGN